ncbi:hypothetical protein L3i22_030200 [Actinoplanes sp. L3-i22]|nr:hypothetical protein L3i22_030200 [Actinoplanes sp. L3-i22]
MLPASGVGLAAGMVGGGGAAVDAARTAEFVRPARAGSNGRADRTRRARGQDQAGRGQDKAGAARRAMSGGRGQAGEVGSGKGPPSMAWRREDSWVRERTPSLR